MNVGAREARWPPSYDAEQLEETIKHIRERVVDTSWFYATQIDENELFQGDVVELAAHVPFLDEQGDAVTEEDVTTFWLVVGNSCDFGRDHNCTQIVPVEDWTLALPSTAEIVALRSYVYSRSFFLPTWSEPGCWVADFTRPVSVHKGALESKRMRVVARLAQHGWYLLNCCLVRFLARADGRFD